MGVVSRVLNGEMHLGKAFWLYGIILAGIFRLAIFYAEIRLSQIIDKDETAIHIAVLVFIVILRISFYVYFIIALHCILKSAKNYAENTFWGSLSKAYVAIAFIYILSSIVKFFIAAAPTFYNLL